MAGNKHNRGGNTSLTWFFWGEEIAFDECFQCSDVNL